MDNKPVHPGLTKYRKVRQKGKLRAILRRQLEEFKAKVLEQNPSCDPKILRNLVTTEQMHLVRKLKQEAKRKQD